MERPIIVASIVCPACGASAAVETQRCANCGAVQPISPGSSSICRGAEAPQSRPVIDCGWQLLLLLFGATGVLGLPLLWTSRAFGVLNKLVLSVLVTLWTALLVWLCWWSLTWSASRLGFEW